MTTIIKGATNGGGNRFFVKDGEVLVAGADVSGRQKIDADILGDVWGFEKKSTGSLMGEIDDSQIKVFEIMTSVDGEKVGTGDYRVVISGEIVDGQYRFDFTEDYYKDVNFSKIETGLATSGITTDGEVSRKTEGAAMNFALFLEAMPETDAFDLIEDAGGDTGAITKIDDAVDGLTYDDITADFRVKFAGEGVSGRTFTDAFSSEAAAENFIDAVHLAATENGFLDDILL